MYLKGDNILYFAEALLAGLTLFIILVPRTSRKEWIRKKLMNIRNNTKQVKTQLDKCTLKSTVNLDHSHSKRGFILV